VTFKTNETHDELTHEFGRLCEIFNLTSTEWPEIRTGIKDVAACLIFSESGRPIVGIGDIWDSSILIHELTHYFMYRSGTAFFSAHSYKFFALNALLHKKAGIDYYKALNGAESDFSPGNWHVFSRWFSVYKGSEEKRANQVFARFLDRTERSSADNLAGFVINVIWIARPEAMLCDRHIFSRYTLRLVLLGSAIAAIKLLPIFFAALSIAAVFAILILVRMADLNHIRRERQLGERGVGRGFEVLDALRNIERECRDAHYLGESCPPNLATDLRSICERAIDLAGPLAKQDDDIRRDYGLPHDEVDSAGAAMVYARLLQHVWISYPKSREAIGFTHVNALIPLAAAFWQPSDQLLLDLQYK
jgi:hypothetical protein